MYTYRNVVPADEFAVGPLINGVDDAVFTNAVAQAAARLAYTLAERRSLAERSSFTPTAQQRSWDELASGFYTSPTRSLAGDHTC